MNRIGGFGLNYDQGFTGRRAGSGGFGDPTKPLQDSMQQDRLFKQGQEGETGRANIAANASTLPARLQQERFQSVFPFLQGQLGQFGSEAFRAGGQSPQSPNITVGPIWDQNQIQGQVNALRAGNDQSTQSRTTEMQRGLAGRGFGSNSPLAAALGAQFQGQNLAENTRGERELRWGAAEGNAGHLLGTERAREDQFASRQQEDIERRKPYIGAYSSLLASLANLV